MNGELRVKEFIETKLERWGKGTEDDPVRVVTSLWTKVGTKIAEYDPFTCSGWYRPEEVAVGLDEMEAQ